MTVGARWRYMALSEICVAPVDPFQHFRGIFQTIEKKRKKKKKTCAEGVTHVRKKSALLLELLMN